MSATTIDIESASRPKRPAVRRRALQFAALLAASAAMFGATFGMRELVSPRHENITVPAQTTPTPRSPQIEKIWGVEIKSIFLLADTGVIDVRYSVLDDGKAARLHTDGNTGLPSLRTQDHGTVKPEAVMFHFHAKAGDTNGQGYDIMYANTHGALHVGSLVTVVMSDGLELAGVPVKD
jgi:hypothetical protein